MPSESFESSVLSLPPPAPTRSYHQRSRTATDLPPLFTRTQSHSPSRSSTFLPFFRPHSTRSLSPERLSDTDTFYHHSPVSPPVPPPEQAPPSKKLSSTAASKLASWFDGTSEPFTVSLVPSPNKEKLDPIAESGIMDNLFSNGHDSVDHLTKRPQKRSSVIGSPSNNTSRFSFFRKSTVSLPSPDPTDQDELGQLDIREALFPHGYPDEFSPATFKNLQLNAEGSLRRFQTAHIDQSKALKQLSSSKVALSDELEAASTRNEHLKLQLEDMAEKAAAQERLITGLTAQLAAQRAPRQTVDCHQRSVRMVPDDASAHDLEPTPRSRYRRSRRSDSSMSAESEAASEVSSVVSVFSEALSAAPSQDTSIASPTHKPSCATFNEECPNCHGLSASEAWDVVGVMKMESVALKRRIGQLECAQDEALDFLSGLRLT
ncbi:hypothetical protein B0A52_06905 [Exophiala mesophila]|uniref:Uncharacterized protein n=1 Tax=Exophiala mesophila TaxID=212818 RepID=A0A438N0Q5_EXOME|nr:hypothetical protein B0A52_06905 [Exophiala mesophila]